MKLHVVDHSKYVSKFYTYTLLSLRSPSIQTE
nr:MAG TPA: hypothetical protein [Caudoviricetes sp.]